MIDTKKVIKLVRYKIGDTGETQFSQYDIFFALNEALRYITHSQAVINSDFLEKIRIFDESNYNGHNSFAIHGIPLPEDFVTLVGITRLSDGRRLKPTEIANIPKETEYKITNNKVYTGTKAFALAYKKNIPEITEETDDIELPVFCLDIIVKTTVMILQQVDGDILMQAVDTVTNSIIPRRRYVGAETKMPFYC